MDKALGRPEERAESRGQEQVEWAEETVEALCKHSKALSVVESHQALCF